MSQTKAILFTFSTYGTWLRGGARRWVDDGIIFPPNAELDAYDRNHLKQPPYFFPRDRLLDTATALGNSLITRLDLQILALTLQVWHAHIVVAATPHDVSVIAKCAKDAARYHLRTGGRIWGMDYDKRFCFDDSAVVNRIHYVNRHNLQNGWTENPFGFVTPYIGHTLSPRSLTGG